MPVDAPGVTETPTLPIVVDAAVLDAALECYGRWGITRSTLEDIAREAGLSRATVYRLFPGGKPALSMAVAHRELERLVALVRLEVAAAPDVETAVAAAMVVASRFLADHRPLQYLMQHERDAVLRFIAFDRLEPALAMARSGIAPELARFVPVEVAEEIAEWATRMVLSMLLAPGSVDPTDSAQVGAFVHRFLAPGLLEEPVDPAPSQPGQISEEPNNRPTARRNHP